MKLPGWPALCLAIAALLAPAAHAEEDYAVVRRQYVDQLGFLVRQNLNLRLVKPENQEAMVAVMFDASGKYLEFRIEERNGNHAFDVALESALRRSIPAMPLAPVPPGEARPFAIRILVR